MNEYICTTCGVQYEKSKNAPDRCLICEDERQYVNWNGQEWTTMSELNNNYKNIFRELDKNVISIQTEPRFGIGQRAFLIKTAYGNVLWDCISLLDEETISSIINHGGISVIALSHPHFYSSMVKWSKMFGNVPIYIHSADKRWVQNHSPNLRFWDGQFENINDGITLINCGGHFKGSSVLHWAGGAEGKGTLFTADTINVGADKKSVSFMYSFPNNIPLTKVAVERIHKSVKSFQFDRIYGGWSFSNILKDAKKIMNQSVKRYIRIRS